MFKVTKEKYEQAHETFDQIKLIAIGFSMFLLVIWIFGMIASHKSIMYKPLFIMLGILFLLYGLYRAIARPGMSVVLTVISLGTRVLLAYTLSMVPWIGVTGIWLSVPIGWALADLTGIFVYRRLNRRRCATKPVS